MYRTHLSLEIGGKPGLHADPLRHGFCHISHLIHLFLRTRLSSIGDNIADGDSEVAFERSRHGGTGSGEEG